MLSSISSLVDPFTVADECVLVAVVESSSAGVLDDEQPRMSRNSADAAMAMDSPRGSKREMHHMHAMHATPSENFIRLDGKSEKRREIFCLASIPLGTSD